MLPKDSLHGALINQACSSLQQTKARNHSTQLCLAHCPFTRSSQTGHGAAEPWSPTSISSIGRKEQSAVVSSLPSSATLTPPTIYLCTNSSIRPSKKWQTKLSSGLRIQIPAGQTRLIVASGHAQPQTMSCLSSLAHNSRA